VNVVKAIAAWFNCTDEAAEHIVTCAAENAQLTGVPLENNLGSIIERAGLPAFICSRGRQTKLTLAEVKELQQTFRRIRCRLDEEATTP
jgi:hypothetical protein